MILFFNVLVTDQRASASGLNRADRLDVFKYALASYAWIGRNHFDFAIIYCQLDGSYKARETELRDYVEMLFHGRATVVYNSHSPSTQQEWQRMLEHTGLHLTSEPILYMGNDDHVFIDSDLTTLYEGLDLMAGQPADQINTVHISSWTEAISTVYGLNDFTQASPRYWAANLLYSDACQIVNATFFRHIFFDLDLGSAYMRRTDDVLTNWYPYLGDFKYPLNSAARPHPVVKTFIPLRELVRHFDAYHHIEVPLDCVPMLDLPAGFTDHPLRQLARPVQTYEAHVKAMVAPHNRGYQRPGVRTPAIWPARWRDLGNGVLPLPDQYLLAARSPATP